MDPPINAALLRIYVGHNDAYEDTPLDEALVLKARELGMAGATAIRGILGYGQPSHAKTSALLLIRDATVLIEVVDVRAKIETYLAAIEPMIRSGLVTIEDIKVVRYGPGTGQAALC
jgi:PII-like signaling protein